ncbi:MAG: hypothetical protein IKF53_04110 [Clostridia bacterium]|nr:hypothetical protein [Clostridia bacterium]
MKKLISILACITLIACLVIPVSADNVNTLTVTVDPASATLSAGDSADFAVNIANVPADCTSASVELVLSSGLTYNKYTWGSVTEEDPTIRNFNKSTLSGVLGVDANESDRITNGKLITFKIAVADTASAAETVKVNVQITVGGQKYDAVSGTATITVPHDHVYTAETVDAKYLKSEATCTAPAVYYKSCTICGEASTTETFTYGEALNHDYKDTIVPPTCTEKGYTEHVCSRGDDTYKDNYTDALGHDLIEEVDDKYLATAANCKEPATYYKHCSRCDFISTETFKYGDLGDHIYSTEWTANPKEHYHICTICGKETADVAPHTAGDWEVVKEPTTKEEGERAILCTVCGYKLDSEPIDKLIEYKVTEGADSTFKAGGKAIKIGTNIPKDGLASLVVKVDGVVVDSENYTVSGEEKVEVTLKPEFLATLKTGKRTVTITATNDDGVGLATAEITVEEEKPASTDTAKKSDETADISIYFVMMLLISTAVLVSTLVYRKKVK